MLERHRFIHTRSAVRLRPVISGGHDRRLYGLERRINGPVCSTAVTRPFTFQGVAALRLRMIHQLEDEHFALPNRQTAGAQVLVEKGMDVRIATDLIGLRGPRPVVAS